MSRRAWPAVMLLTLLVVGSLAVPSRAQEGEVRGRIAFVRDGGIWVWEGGETSRLLSAEGISDARWAPDGETILFVRGGNSFSDLALLSVQNVVVTQLTRNQSSAEVGSELYTTESVWAIDPSWSRSGRIAFVSDDPGGVTLFGIWLMDGPDGDPYSAGITASDNIDSVSLSGDGNTAAFVVRERGRGDGTLDTGVWLADLASGEVLLAAQSSGEVFDPAMSPDGSQIAVAIREPGGGTDVWLVDRATLDRRRVTRDAEAIAPAWSPDGRHLAYLKLEDYQFEIWVVEISGDEAGEPRKLFAADGLDSRSGLSWWLPPDEIAPEP